MLLEIPDYRPNPLDMLEKKEAERAVRAGLARLSPDHRTALILRDWEDLPYDEISSVLGIPIGTVRSRLHNARVTLAKRCSAAKGRVVERRFGGDMLPGHRGSSTSIGVSPSACSDQPSRDFGFTGPLETWRAGAPI